MPAGQDSSALRLVMPVAVHPVGDDRFAEADTSAEMTSAELDLARMVLGVDGSAHEWLLKRKKKKPTMWWAGEGWDVVRVRARCGLATNAVWSKAGPSAA